MRCHFQVLVLASDRFFIASWTLGPNLSALRLNAVRQ